MDWLENNILKEKLEQLDSLPEGYTPSLESKFELLMAASHAPAKRLPRIYYLIPAAAAAITAVIFYLSGTSHKVDYAARHYSGHKHVEPITSTTSTIKTESALHPPQSQRTLKDQSPIARPSGVITQPAVTVQNVAHFTPVSTEQAGTLTPSEQTQKKEKKLRYTEIDFNDVPVTLATDERTNTSKQRVAFKFSIFNTTAGTSYNTSPVQIKQNF